MVKPSIKIFLDGADRPTITEMAPNPLVQGFTTNPSLMRKAGVTDYAAYCKALLPELNGKPVSFEVFADDAPEMRRQALEIASWEKYGKPGQIYVKIPVMNSRGEPTTALVKELAQAGVRQNVTAIYLISQVEEVAAALKGGAPSIISVFAGRMADVGYDPVPMMRASAQICTQTDRSIELLWASTREAFNIIQAEEVGAKIITSPADMIRKVPAFGRDLFDLSLDTVRIFKKDSEAAGFKL